MPARRLRRVPVLLALAALAGPFSARVVAAQSLRGSEESVNDMYARARERGLTFFRTSRGVRTAVREGEFVRLTGNRDYRTAKTNFPYVKSTTRTFIERLAAEYRAQCREKLVVTSAVRPMARQPRNASDKSVHPTGMAVDLRKPARAECRQWLRNRLLELEMDGAIEAIEEYRPPHFHVAVYSANLFATAQSVSDR